MAGSDFVFGVDLDGVVADFYGYMRRVTAEWRDINLDELTTEVTFGLPERGLEPDDDRYERLHRFAMNNEASSRTWTRSRDASSTSAAEPREGPDHDHHAPALPHAHTPAAVLQTVHWLEHHAVPYRDLCFVKEKGEVSSPMSTSRTRRRTSRTLAMPASP
ncbi:hypothetical protein [Kitasatospora sp. NPDC059327]|uniref:5' nucleotidase, NT5C type n=1 Tax=Kitasatospora sp. NPDC059327 TaxID=3346803 RepID=UPI0036B7EBA6